MGDSKVVRSCILCGAKDGVPMFTYTYDFLTNVRGHPPEELERTGWTKDTTSTIVKCGACSCIYVRDVVVWPESFRRLRSEEWRTAEAAEELARTTMAARATYKNYRALDNENWVIRNLVWLAADFFERDIKFLDFGAGGGTSSNAARVYGVRDVIAYDPNYIDSIQTHFDRTSHPGIRCVRSKDELPELGPFDAAVFQSAVEHVLDPRAELKTIYDNMSEGGYLYVNNPFMDLENEIGELCAATRIEKRDSISHYHAGHLNYMTPMEFSRLLREVGFRITPLLHYPPIPLTWRHLGRYLIRNMKFGVRMTQNILGIPYHRFFFIVRKP